MSSNGSLNLPVNSQHMIQDFIEQDKRYIKFFFVKDFKPGFHIVSQFFLIHWNIILKEPVNTVWKFSKGICLGVNL